MSLKQTIFDLPNKDKTVRDRNTVCSVSYVVEDHYVGQLADKSLKIVFP